MRCGVCSVRCRVWGVGSVDCEVWGVCTLCMGCGVAVCAEIVREKGPF